MKVEKDPVLRHLGRVLILLILLSSPLVAQKAAAASTHEDAAESALKTRVTKFWTSWQNGDSEALTALVRREDRPAFSVITRFQVNNFSLMSIQFSKDLKAAIVVTNVRRVVALFGHPIDWPTENEWVYTQGNWYLKYQQGEKPGLFAPGGKVYKYPQPPPPPQTYGGELAFRETVHDFGKVPLGTPLHWEYEFENHGPKTVRLTRVVGGCLDATLESVCLTAHSNGTFFEKGSQGKIVAELADVSKPQKVDTTVEVDTDWGQAIKLRFVAEITPRQ
ncbi:MAG: DUF1573 domain-containing protein [Acidobacteriia bacterium]|nr:DUF1573 domain-containing protein [Terriglobia bacterium]